MSGLEDYTLGVRLGLGGAGEVVEATHRSLGILVAIKFLPGLDATAEARRMARIAHPNVLRVFDTGLDERGSWIVMQRARHVLKEVADFPDWVAVMEGILKGLGAAHARGTLHLDLKPGNLLVLPDGTVALADFGLSAIGERAILSAGTPAFMAPEAFFGEADRRSDLYSVGCVAYALLCGRPPFEGSWSELAAAHANQAPPRHRDPHEGAWRGVWMARGLSGEGSGGTLPTRC